MTDVIQSEIITEVRNARRKILESFGGDFELYCRDVMKRQGQSGHPLVTEPVGVYQPVEEKPGKVAEKQMPYKTASDAE